MKFRCATAVRRRRGAAAARRGRERGRTPHDGARSRRRRCAARASCAARGAHVGTAPGRGGACGGGRGRGGGGEAARTRPGSNRTAAGKPLRAQAWRRQRGILVRPPRGRGVETPCGRRSCEDGTERHALDRRLCYARPRSVRRRPRKHAEACSAAPAEGTGATRGYKGH